MIHEPINEMNHSGIVLNFLDRCCVSRNQCGEQLQSRTIVYLSSVPSQLDARKHDLSLRMDAPASRFSMRFYHLLGLFRFLVSKASDFGRISFLCYKPCRRKLCHFASKFDKLASILAFRTHGNLRISNKTAAHLKSAWLAFFHRTSRFQLGIEFGPYAQRLLIHRLV